MDLKERMIEFVTNAYAVQGNEIKNMSDEFLMSLFKQGVTSRLHHYKYNKRIRNLAKLAIEHELE